VTGKARISAAVFGFVEGDWLGTTNFRVYRCDIFGRFGGNLRDWAQKTAGKKGYQRSKKKTLPRPRFTGLAGGSHEIGGINWAKKGGSLG